MCKPLQRVLTLFLAVMMLVTGIGISPASANNDPFSPFDGDTLTTWDDTPVYDWDDLDGEWPTDTGPEEEPPELPGDDTPSAERQAAKTTDSTLAEVVSLGASTFQVMVPIGQYGGGIMTRAAGDRQPLEIEQFPQFYYDFAIAPGWPIYGPWQIYRLNGTVVYCIEPKVLVSTTGAMYTSTYTWTGLDEEQQTLIGRIIYYGGDGNDLARNIAIQSLIWEVVLGYRDMTTFSRTSNYIYNGLIAGQIGQTYYNEIVAKIQDHYTIPDFMARSQAAAPNYVLTDNGSGAYEYQLTDSKRVISDYIFPDISGVTFSVSSNTLTIKSSRAIPIPELIAASKGGNNGGDSGSLVFWTTPDLSVPEQVKVNFAGSPDPVKGYMTIATEGEPTTPPAPEPNDGEYRLQIIKRDSVTNKLLDGVTFEIRHTSHGVIGRYTTDESGGIDITVKWAGTYIITEVSTKSGYVMPSDPDFELYVDVDNPTAEATFYNDPYGALLVEKVCSVTGAKLPGASFTITEIATGIPHTGTTGPDGTLLIGNLRPGAYSIVETAPPVNYQLNPQNYSINVQPGAATPASISIPNTPNSEGIQIIKVDEATGERLANAEFQIREISTGALYTARSDSNGIAEVLNLPPADYEIVEIVSPAGYVLNSQPVSLSLRPGTLEQVVISNQKKGGLFIKKVTPDGGPIAGAVFEIHRDTELIGVFTTDTNGYIHIENLTSALYKATEISAPTGYYIDKENNPKSIYIDTASETKEFYLTFVNYPKPSIEILKVDSNDPKKVLAGATFRIAEQGGSLSWDVKTDENGIASKDNLEPGIVYEVVEIIPPGGYTLGTTPFSQLIVLTPGERHTLIVENEKLPNLTLIKRDKATGELLPNATFRLAKDGSNAYQDIRTDENGRAEVIGLDEGLWTLFEIIAPDGYLLSDEIHRVRLTSGSDTVIEAYNEAIPKIRIIKLDSVTQTPLPFAIFDIYQITDTGTVYLGEFTTNEDGEILLENVTPGRFRITEKQPPDGYELAAEATKEITLSYAETATVQFLNTPKSPIYIYKVSGDGLPLSGAQFTVHHMNGELIGTFTSGRTGYAIVPNVGSGYFLITEIRSPDGYTISSEPQIVQVRSGTPAFVEFVNHKQPGVIIQKLSQDGTPLMGARIRITTAAGAYVGEYTTGRDGLITLHDFGIGTFIAVEVAAPDGYLLSSEPVIFETKPGEITNLVFYNDEIPGLQLAKYDSETLLPVPNATYSLVRLTGTGKQDLGTYTTGTNGLFYVPDLTPGNYILTEIRCPGYIVDPTPIYVTVEANKLNTVEAFNTPYANLRIYKYSEEDNKPLSGAVFRLYDAQRIEIGTYQTNELGEILIENTLPAGVYYLQEISAPSGYEADLTVRKIELKGTVTVRISNKALGSLRLLKRDAKTRDPIYGVEFLLLDSKDNVIGSYTTDQRGIIDFGRLPSGTYKIREIRAASGYVQDDVIRTVNVREGSTVEIIWDNTPETGSIRIVKVAAGKNSITGHKKGDYLSGATFRIFDASNLNHIDTITTDRRGVATFSDLPLGRYIIRETRAPQYFYTDGKPIYVEVKKHGDEIRLYIENQPDEIEVTVQKRGNVEAMPGDIIRYDFSNIANESNVALNEFYWADHLPTDAVRIQSLNTGTYNERVKYELWIKTNLKGWQRIRTNLYSNVDYTIDMTSSALGLAGNEYVTEYKLSFGTVDAGFRQVDAPFITCKVLEGLADGYRFTNKTDVGGKRNKEWAIAQDSWTTVIFKPNRPLPKTGY